MSQSVSLLDFNKYATKARESKVKDHEKHVKIVKYKTIQKALVRKASDLKSKKVKGLEVGTEIHVVEIQKNRARIIHPCSGWISMQTKDGTHIVKRKEKKKKKDKKRKMGQGIPEPPAKRQKVQQRWKPPEKSPLEKMYDRELTEEEKAICEASWSKLDQRLKEHESYYDERRAQDIERNRDYDPRPKRDWQAWERKGRADRREKQNLEEKIKLCDEYIKGETDQVDPRIQRDIDFWNRWGN